MNWDTILTGLGNGVGYTIVITGVGVITGTVGYFRGRLGRLSSLWRSGEKSGIVANYSKLPFAQLEADIASAKSHVDVLQTWISNGDHLLKPLVQAAQNGAKVRILLLNPNSIMVDYRSREYMVPQNPDHSRTMLTRLVDQLKHIRAENHLEDSFDIRVYDCTPVVGLYRIDKYVYIGNFWNRGAAFLGPHLKVEEGGFYCTSARIHFDGVWNDQTHTKPA